MPATRWSLVAKAGDRQRADWTAAVGQLVVAYRPVLVRHLIAHMQLPPDRAEDTVQSFLADKVLANNVLGLAERSRGRFRSFLLKTFSNYVIGQLRRDRAQKRRAVGVDAVSLDAVTEPSSREPALRDAFDSVWARQILARTLDLMREECRLKNRPELWDVFEARILGPLLDQADPLPYERLVERFGLRSPSEASNLLITAKRMFSRVLREVVRETVVEERDVEAEIRDLRRALARL
jgi:RNA polymerase sigma-70 factor (ECF subfamily)